MNKIIVVPAPKRMCVYVSIVAKTFVVPTCVAWMIIFTYHITSILIFYTKPRMAKFQEIVIYTEQGRCLDTCI